jgi:hypothetical protein
MICWKSSLWNVPTSKMISSIRASATSSPAPRSKNRVESIFWLLTARGEGQGGGDVVALGAVARGASGLPRDDGCGKLVRMTAISISELHRHMIAAAPAFGLQAVTL